MRPALTAKRNAFYGNRAVDGKPYVNTQYVHPARIYIGKKGYNARGEPATDFLSRNGLAYGQVYGFGALPTAFNGEYGDVWHRNTANTNGAQVVGGFYPIDWQWNGTVHNFEHDADWHWQEAPLNAPPGTKFWTGAGADTSAAKTEHCTPSPTGEHAYYQGSTAGYIGHYAFPTLGDDLDKLSGAAFPKSIGATYTMLVGEQDVTGQISLGGKGQRADGKAGNFHPETDGTMKRPDGTPRGTLNSFEDPDGLEALASPDGDYLIMQEDSHNMFGERMFISKVRTDKTPMDWKLIAMSGGSHNTRNKGGVAIPAGTHSIALGHEFSGIVDFSGLLFKMNGDYYVKAADAGFKKRQAEKMVPINDKLIALGLQAHSYRSGVIDGFRCDRGGQVRAWRAGNDCERALGSGRVRPPLPRPPLYIRSTSTSRISPKRAGRCATRAAARFLWAAAHPREFSRGAKLSAPAAALADHRAPDSLDEPVPIHLCQRASAAMPFP